MIVRHLHTVHELLCVLAQPTPELLLLRTLLTDQGRFPARRPWERWLQVLSDTLLLPQIRCLGRHLVVLLQPWATYSRAAAMDRTVLRAHGGVWQLLKAA